MLDEIVDWFSELDGQKVGIAFLLWALCMAMIWKFFDQSILTFQLRILVSVLMLPVCYFILNIMGDNG